jgi:folate-binding protein YgfZ
MAAAGLPGAAPAPTFAGMTQTAALPARGVIEIGGEDRVTFLQGLVSNDVAAAAPGRAVWTALLTPQGKWLADFFILADGGLAVSGLADGGPADDRPADGGRLLLECERAQVAMLVPRLARFRLRSKVTVAARDDLSVFVAWGGPPPEADVAAPDPRLPDAGWRMLSTAPLETNATAADWDLHRLRLGLPDGSADLEAEKTILLEAGFDELNGVAWDKGCYMGQELTARTKYRGLVKRRLVPVTVDGPLPTPGTPVLRDGAEVGTMRSGRDALGLAVLRLEALRGDLTCGEARLTPHIPDWMRLPEAVS